MSGGAQGRNLPSPTRKHSFGIVQCKGDPARYARVWRNMLAHVLDFCFEEGQRHIGRGMRKPPRAEPQFANALVKSKCHRQPPLSLEIGRHARLREKTRDEYVRRA
jgi:hypothetical protein